MDLFFIFIIGSSELSWLSSIKKT